MTERADAHRFARALRAALLACLALALAGPGFASAAGTDDGRPRASAAREGSGLAGAEGASRAGRAAESAEEEGSERERGPEEPSRESEAEPRSDDESASEAREGSGPAARADRDSSALRDSIRREVRSATEGIKDSVRREVRSATEGIGDSVRRDVGSRPERTGRRARDGGAPAPPSQGRRRGEAPRDGARDLGEGDEVRISASGGEPIDLDSRDNRQIYLGRTATVRGVVPSQRPGREVVLEAYSRGRWVEVDRDITDENGRFSMTWKPGYAGHRYVRVRRTNPASTESPSGIRTLYVYRKRVASWYGPGFYGNRTACGQTFTSRLMGVAHRSLPCGYIVTIRYNGRYRTVPVVDRGPYVRGRDFDLTEALRNYLGFDGVDTVRATA